MQTIVLASSNQGKVKEFNELLRPLGYECIPQSALGISDAEETGTTFIENALIKAKAAAVASGLPALADDSGLCVQGLKGAPGVYSARYAGENATDNDNCNLLISTLKAEPKLSRKAFFISVLVLFRHADDPTPVVAQATWAGEILLETRGTKGFGYDPLFYIPELEKTAAELDSETKNSFSHRGQALQQLLSHLSK